MIALLFGSALLMFVCALLVYVEYVVRKNG